MSTGALALGMAAALLAAGVAAAPRDAERPPAVAERPTKPLGPIAADYRLAAEPALGVPLTITVTARAAGAPTLALEATASQPEALQLAAPVLVSSAAGRFEWALTVVPLRADAGFVNALVTGTIDGVDQARSIVIPLRVVAASPAAPARADEAGENLIALPVDEGR